jgi:hypothetical protein
MEAKIEAYNKKVEILQSKMWTSQEEKKAMLEACLEKDGGKSRRSGGCDGESGSP